jgi:hypothetical protein
MWKIASGVVGVAVLAFLILRNSNHSDSTADAIAAQATSSKTAVSGANEVQPASARGVTEAASSAPVEVRFTNYENLQRRVNKSTTGTIVVNPRSSSSSTSR